MSKLAGGVSLSRGRRHHAELRVGDALDFWRVLVVRAPLRLLLLGEMKGPGEAVLDFQVVPLPNGQADLKVIGRFWPNGLPGILYWYTLLPLHAWIYKGFRKAIATRIDRPIVKGPELFLPVEEELTIG